MEHRDLLDSPAEPSVTEEPATPQVPDRVLIAGCEIDLRAHLVSRDGEDCRITPKAAAVLRYLVARPNQAVSREELLDEVWRDAFPTDDVLSHAIADLRRVLGDNARNSEIIETIPKVGYRLLVMPVPVPDAVAVPVDPALDPDQPQSSRRRHSGAGLVLAVLLGAVLGAAGMRWYLGPVPPQHRATVAVDPLASAFPVTARTGRERMPSVSSDGRQVVYTAETEADDGYDLYIMSLGSDTASRLTDTPGESEFTPVWSPNADKVAFYRYSNDECGLFIKPVVGGFERRMSDCAPDAVTYIDWSPDGSTIAMTGRLNLEQSSSGILMLDVDTGQLRELDYEQSDSEHDVQPRFSPDGERILFRRGAFPRSELFVVGTGGGPVRQLTQSGSQVFGFDWLPDGETVWYCSDQSGRPALWEIALAGGSSQLIGSGCTYMLSVATEERVLTYEAIEEDPNIVEAITAGDAQHIDLPVFPSTQHESDPSYAPDGRRVVYVSDRSGDDQLWIGDLVTDENYQLTRHQGMRLLSPRWSPDAGHVVYIGRDGGGETLYRINVVSGLVEELSEAGEGVRSASVAHDGSRIFYSSNRGGNWNIWSLHPETGERRQITQHGGHRPTDPRGDGYLYYTKVNIFGLWRMPVDGGREELVTDEVAYHNHEAWVIRGNFIYLPLANGSSGASIHRLALEDPDDKRPVLSLESEDQVRLHDVAPDGERFLLVRVQEPRQDIMAVDGW